MIFYRAKKKKYVKGCGFSSFAKNLSKIKCLKLIEILSNYWVLE